MVGLVDDLHRSRGVALAMGILLAVVARPALACPQAADESLAAVARAWPPVTEDLPPDPALHFGQLDNGLRYVWRHHAQPAGRCSLRLVVHVGSLDEADDERGMAHFVEHMAFNGTRRFPGTTIQQWFRARGMRFGLHANAFTSMADTTYRVDLPDHDEAALRDGLDVLRQFADGVLFEAGEVESEKGVVDAEQREYYSVPRQAQRTCQERLLAGSRRAERNPIGIAAERASFTAERLRAFHDRWYRADNMTLVLVGDLGERDVDALCRGTFGTMARPSTPLPMRVPIGVPTLAEPSFAIDEPGRADVEWFVQCLAAQPAPPASAAAVRDSVLRDAAVEMGWWLLAETLRQAGSPVMAPRVDEAPWAEELSGIVLYFRNEPARSAAALAECCRALRALHPAEFTSSLLDRVRKTRFAHMESELAAVDRQSGVSMANELADGIAVGRVPCEPRFMIELERTSWNELTAAACASYWFGAWGKGLLSVVSIGPAGHGIDTAGEQRELASRLAFRAIEWAASPREQEPQPAASADAEPAWPYAIAADDVAGVISERSRDPLSGVEQVQFENGVRVLIKQLDAAAGQVFVEANVGAGQWLLSAAERQAAHLFERMVPESGLLRMPTDDLRRLTSRRPVTLAARTDFGRFVLRGRCDAASLPFQLEWLFAQLSEPNFDEAVHRRVTESYEARYGQVGASGRGLELAFVERLTEQSVGFVAERVAAVPVDAVRDLFTSRWHGQPLTLVVVGDLDPEATLALAARTFGRLPPLQAAAALAAGLHYQPIERARREQRDLPPDQGVGSVMFFVPLPDLERLTLGRWRLLELILQPRLRAIVREAMGATYECRVEQALFMTERPTGAFRITVQVAPGRERDVEAAIRHELALLVAKGVTTDELDVARRQWRNVVREWQQGGEYWCARLAWAHLRPAGLQQWAAAEDELTRLTAEQLSASAAAWFDDERLSVLVLRASPKAK